MIDGRDNCVHDEFESTWKRADSTKPAKVGQANPTESGRRKEHISHVWILN